MKIIYGRSIAEEILEDIEKEVDSLEGPYYAKASKGRAPSLAIVLVGERKDSDIYVKLKEKRAREVGIDTHLYKCSSNAEEEDIIEIIEHLNGDDEVDAILVQLPLPKKLNADRIIGKMDPKKDVDRFHPDNLRRLVRIKRGSMRINSRLMPPVFAVILRIFDQVNYDLKNKKVCIIANSDIFGKSLVKVLECLGAEVVVVGSDDSDIRARSVEADVLITAVGKPEFIKEDMVKEGAMVIDIGITKEKNKVVGDVDSNDVINKCSYITPVPGGVGPMTVAMLLKNVVALAKK